ncbi:hypothetical protein WA158_008491 [Blastocystis sp. Blastoise]
MDKLLFYQSDSSEESIEENDSTKKVKRKRTDYEKVRTFQHIDGNWPSIIYINIRVHKKIMTKLLKIKDYMNKVIESYYKSEDEIPEMKLLTDEKTGNTSIHVSLSKAFVLKKYQISSFYEALKNELKYYKKFKYSLKPFRFFLNDTHTRSFGSLLVKDGYYYIKRIISSIDSVMKRYNKAIYYSPAIPHATICSVAIDIEQHLKESGFLILPPDTSNSISISTKIALNQIDNPSSDIDIDYDSDESISNNDNSDSDNDDSDNNNDDNNNDDNIDISEECIFCKCDAITFTAGNQHFEINLID